MDINTIFIGIIFGSIGLGYFIYGKKQSQPVTRFTGIGLMVYPYLIPTASVATLIMVGVALLLVPKFLKI